MFPRNIQSRWFGKQSANSASAPQRRRRQNAAKSRSLCLEILEDRSVPAVVNWIGAVDGDWSNAANWFNTDTTTNIVPVDGDELVFDSGNLTGSAVATGLNNDLGALTSVLSIDFGDGAFTITTGNALTVTSDVTVTGAGDELLGIVINGAASVDMSGSGTFTLAAANGYTGTTNVNTGILQVTNGTALGSTAGGTVVDTGATLDFANVVYGLSEAITLDGGTIATSTGTSSFFGAITLTTASGILDVDGTMLTLSGSIAGNFGLEINGAGILALSGTNLFTGVTNINAGTLQVASASALGTVDGGTVVDTGATLDFPNIAYGLAEGITLAGGTISGSTSISSFAGDISLTTASDAFDVDGAQLILSGTISGSFGFEKTGLGTLSLAAANSFTGDINVTEGILGVSVDGALGTTGGVTNLGANGALGFDVVAYNTIETVTVAGGTIGSQGVSSFAGDIQMTGFTTFNVLDNSLTLSGEISGATGLESVGAGTLILTGANTYTGVTDVVAGILQVGSATALGTVAGGTTVDTGATLDIAGITYSLLEGLTLDGGTISASTGASVFNGAISLTTADGTVDVDGTSLTLGGVISGGFGFDKTGTGILSLGGNNTFTGAVDVNAGTLQVTADNALGTVAGATNVAAVATLDFANVTYTALEAISIAGGTISASTGTSSLAGNISLLANSIIDVDGTSLEIDGNISGAFGLQKTGAGALILDGVDNFMTLNVSAGVLGGSGTLITALVVADGATLDPGPLGGTGILLNAVATTFAANSTFAVTINSATPGTGHDQFITDGLTLTGATLDATGVFAAPVGTEIILIDNSGGAVSGEFSGLAEGSFVTVGAQSYQISYVGGDGNDVTLTAVSGGSDTVGVFNPKNATWYLRDANNNDGPPDYVFQFGGRGMIGVTGDWDGDGVDTIGVFDPNTATWYMRNENNNNGSPDYVISYGFSSGIPVVGDWDGDGTDTIGIYNPANATWYLRNSNSAGSPDEVFSYGFGAFPVVGNWDGVIGDGIGVYNAANATWYLRDTASAGSPDAGVFAYGFGGVRPVTGDWDFDGSDGIGVFSQNATWYLRNEANSGSADAGVFQYGGGSLTPVTGNWTGPITLMAAGHPTGSGSPVTEGDLPPIFAEALSRWGVSGAAGINLTIGDLPGDTLARAVGTSIVIDRDAAGHGWFIDSTPEDDSEFADGEGPEGMDLLTAVMHELGHVFGIEHADEGDANLMARTLRSGVRQEPTSVAVDAVLSSDSLDWLLV